VILDILMPDMDGYQVTRQLRKDPTTAYLPIVMFTSKSQVEDKVHGYEAGIDDYLTKPVHPVELVTRIKTLLARNRGRVLGGTPAKDQGYILGVMAPKGGMGVSSLVLNLAISLHKKYDLDLVAAELRPGNGTWGFDLGIANPTGLNSLLRTKPADLTAALVEKELVRTIHGVRLLMSSSSLRDVSLIQATNQMEIIVQQLATLAPLVLLDIGVPIQPNFDKIAACMQEMIVVTEPYPGTVQRTHLLLDDLTERGVSRSQQLSVIVVNRVRADVQLSVTQVQESLGYPIAQVFPPAPEQAFQAGKRKLPLILVQPESLLTQQFERLAEAIHDRIPK
jgi:pilus assembly protein CpaE